MAPKTEDASPNGDGIAVNGQAVGGNRLGHSASAPAIGGGGRKGVHIMIDPAAPMRDGPSDDTELLMLPSSVPGSPATQKAAARGGIAAWGSSPASGSRPGSRQSGGQVGSRFSSCSTPSSRQHSTSGRFSHEELLCFKRVPTPSSSCDNKRDTYFDPEGSGTLRNKLMNDNWHTLPVLKGKFYSHPRLSESVNHLSIEKVRSQKTHQKRQIQHHKLLSENLPDEALTASLLDEIFPKSLSAWQKERDKDFAVEGASGDSSRRHGRQRSTPMSKRLSGRDLRSQETLKMDASGVLDSTNTTHASGAAPSANFGGTGASTAMASTAGTSPPATREASAAVARKETMLEFRKQMLKQFATIKSGFDFFEQEFPANREMTKKEWRRVLVKLGFDASVEERDAIFDQLDINNNGHVSMMEFHIAMEAAAPVKTMEDLRRRWLASGYTSMASAFTIMYEAAPAKRLTLREFGELLSRVHVNDHAEHVALFTAIADQLDTSRNCKVSIGELAAALATVSPAAYLEEIRHRILKRYNGNAEKAFWDIDRDHSGVVSKYEFKERTVYRMGLTELEADKMFATIDFDKSGTITLNEFLCALSMSEPSLFHEDLRKKVRQRFRSMRDAFDSAMDDFANADLQHNPPLPFSRFEVLLHELDFQHNELRTLFDLIDANKDGKLTIKEFTQGIRHFAPSCVLEDLRLLCLQKFEYVYEAFVDMGVDRQLPLNLETFAKVLEKQGLTKGVDINRVFALLDVRNEEIVSLGKLISALQSGGPGNHIRQPTPERDLHAAQDVKSHMSLHHRFIGDLKLQVRQGLHAPEVNMGLARQAGSDSGRGSDSPKQAHGGESPSGRSVVESPVGHRQAPGHRTRHKGTKLDGAMIAFQAGQTQLQAWPSATPGKKGAQAAGGGAGNQKLSGIQDGQKGPAASGNVDSAGVDAEAGDEEVSIAQGRVPLLRAPPQEELAKYMAKLDPGRIQEHKKIAEDPIVGTQQSWGRLWHCLHKTPDAKERQGVDRHLLAYYQKATKTVSHDVPLLERSHSRHAVHRSVHAHTTALAQNRGPKGQSS